jgi:hypothetical protein
MTTSRKLLPTAPQSTLGRARARNGARGGGFDDIYICIYVQQFVGEGGFGVAPQPECASGQSVAGTSPVARGNSSGVVSLALARSQLVARLKNKHIDIFFSDSLLESEEKEKEYSKLKRKRHARNAAAQERKQTVKAKAKVFVFTYQ